jgi:hypothetical protein
MSTHIVIDNELDMKYIGQLFDIDKYNFGIEPAKNFLEMSERYPWMYHVLRKGDQVLGYTLVMRLREAAHEALKTGAIWEDELSWTDIDVEGPGGLYLSSVAAAESVKGKYPFVSGLLCGIVGGQLGRLSEEVIAIPVTKSGQNIVDMLKMHPIESELNIEGIDGYSPKVYVKEPYFGPLSIHGKWQRVRK